MPARAATQRSILVRVLVCVALLGATALLSGCSRELGRQFVEGDAENYLLTADGVKMHVSCPREPMKKFRSFYCDYSGNGIKSVILIRQLDDGGHISISLDTPIDHTLIEGYLERFERRQHNGLQTIAHCPDRVVARQGQQFHCTVEGPTTPKHPVQVTQIDGFNNYGFLDET